MSTEQKCPECGSQLRFDPSTGEVACTGCGLVVAQEPASPEEPEAAAGSALYPSEAENALTWGKNLGTSPTSVPRRLRRLQQNSLGRRIERLLLARISDYLHASEDEEGRALTHRVGQVALSMLRALEYERVVTERDVEWIARAAIFRVLGHEAGRYVDIWSLARREKPPKPWTRLDKAELEIAKALRSEGCSYGHIAKLLLRRKEVIWQALRRISGFKKND